MPWYHRIWRVLSSWPSRRKITIVWLSRNDNHQLLLENNTDKSINVNLLVITTIQIQCQLSTQDKVLILTLTVRLYFPVDSPGRDARSSWRESARRDKSRASRPVVPPRQTGGSPYRCRRSDSCRSPRHTAADTGRRTVPQSAPSSSR